MASREKVPRSIESLPLLMTVQEVAQVLGVSTRTVNSLRERGELPTVRVGRSVRFSREWIAKLMAEGRG